MLISIWDEDQDNIVKSVQNKSKMKICCKTKNESTLLEQWIEHHAKIVGYENLIIADNDSSDSNTLRLYDTYGDRVGIFRFRGPHNEIHWHPRFRKFFDAIRGYCDFFSYIDVDERLIHLENDKWTADEKITDLLEDRTAIYPTTWLINIAESYTKFCLLDTEKRPIMSNNLKWGKPIFPSRLVGQKSGIHNVQYAGEKFAVPAGGTLFLLHYTQMPHQRIAVNVNKLVSRGVVRPGDDPLKIISLDFSNHEDKTVLRFQAEIKEMLEIIESKRLGVRSDSKFVELAQDRSVKFGDEAARQEFRAYQDNVQRFIKEIFA